MFDPKAFLDAAVKSLTSKDKVEIVKDMLEQIAKFVDAHDIVVPDLSVQYGGASLHLSGKKLEDADASKKIAAEEEAKKLAEHAKTDPDIKAPEPA